MAIAQKITELAVLTEAAADAELPIVDDPSGGAVTKKITASALIGSIATIPTDLNSLPSTVKTGQRVIHDDGIFEYEFVALSTFTPSTASILLDIEAGRYRVDSVNRKTGRIFTYPSSWNGPSPDVYFTSDGRWIHEHSNEKLFRETNMVQANDAQAKGTQTYWVDDIAGSDANGGKSDADALKTLTAAQAKTDVYTIMLKGNGSFYGMTKLVNSMNIIGYGDTPPKIWEPPLSNVFTVHATQPQVWTLDLGAFIVSPPYSAKINDEHGLPMRYTEVATLAEVSNKPLSFFQEDANTIHVHAVVQPVLGVDIYSSISTFKIIPNDSANDNSGHTYYFENMLWVGPFIIFGGQGAKPKCRTMNVSALGDIAILPPFATSGTITPDIIAFKCIAAYGLGDGFGYNGTGFAIEIDCIAYSNNLSGSGSNQASSAHDTVQMLRVGGDYEGAGQNIVLDVGSGQTINLGINGRGITTSNAYDAAATRAMSSFDCKSPGGNHYSNSGTGAVFVSGALADIELGTTGSGVLKLFGET